MVYFRTNYSQSVANTWLLPEAVQEEIRILQNALGLSSQNILPNPPGRLSRATLSVYGSVFSGLAPSAATADLDVTILGGYGPEMAEQLQHGFPDQRQRTLAVLRECKERLERSGLCSVVELISEGARVPLLKMRISYFLETRQQIVSRDIDLTVDNANGLRNSALLRGYAQFPIVRALVVRVKKWAKESSLLINATNGLMSSYLQSRSVAKSVL